MITPEIKDEILGQFISSGMRFTINLKMHCHNFNITFDEFDAILRQFEKLNMPKAQRCMCGTGIVVGGTAHIALNAEAHDFFNRGGFAVQEEILKANLNKLGLELEALSKELGPKYLEKASTLTSLISSATSIIKFFG